MPISYEDVNKYLEVVAFLTIYKFVKKSGVAPKSTQEELLKCLWYLHHKGWLYCQYEDNKISTVIGGYRIKEFKEDLIDIMPETEEGNILFVAINASISTDKLVYRRMLSGYLRENPNITELIFFDRNSDEAKRYPLKRNKNHEQTKDTIVTSNATVSG